MRNSLRRMRRRVSTALPWVGVFVIGLTGIAIGQDSNFEASLSADVDSVEENSDRFTPEQLEFFEAKIRPLFAEHCHQCHSSAADELAAGLRLDRRDEILSGGDSGPAVDLDQPDASLLLRAMKYEEFEMPPDRKLSAVQVADVKHWIAEGAAWPAESSAESSAEEPPHVGERASIDWDSARQSHWAWSEVVAVDPPSVERTDLVADPLDHFVLAKLEQVGLSFSLIAQPVDLVRRIHFDLVGLPPTVAQVAEFETRYALDPAAAVRDRIDELIGTPAYGQRWARHWLDIARYSDGHGGFLDSAALDDAWRYRDWVVQSIQDDLPYDRFVTLQLAGDLIDGYEGAVATGFLALGPTYISDGGDPESVAQARAETLDDRVDTVSRGLLGVTLACARCHDHKFDPIPQADYYGVAGIFNNTDVQPVPLADSETVRKVDEHRAQITAKEQALDELKKSSTSDGRQPNDNETQQLTELQQEIDRLKVIAPPGYDRAHALIDTGSGDMPIAVRGNPLRSGEVVARSYLTLFSELDWGTIDSGSGRVELARAIVDPRNPLTARVIVNRVWGHHFGQPLVRTPSNFGTLGEAPSHPQLLDWLADDFMRHGWSLAHLHRRIMNSATYRQSSEFDARAFEIDGDCRTLWRFPPRRLDVEAWRDSMLSVTGELDQQLGGPPVEDIVRSNRRTLYAKVSRNGDRFSSDTFLRTFDFPSMRASVARRSTSIVPQQFLFLMNSEFVIARARALSDRLQPMGQSDAERIDAAYHILFGRPPEQEELQLGIDFLNASLEESATAAAGESNGTVSDQPAEAVESKSTLGRWVQYTQALLGSNEFMYVR